nr:lipin-like protein [Parasacculina yatsui]
MNYIGRCLNNFKEFYSEINAATLTGAIDVVIVEQQDGTFLTSPFHVRFGKIGVLKSKEKVVDIEINGRPVDIHMKLGESGEAFFVTPLQAGERLSSNQMATSPIPVCMSPHDRRSSSPSDATVLVGESHSDESMFGAAGDGDEVSHEPSAESVHIEQVEKLLESTSPTDPALSCQFKPIPTGEKLRAKQKRRQRKRRPQHSGHHRSLSDSRALMQVLTQEVSEPARLAQVSAARSSLPLPPPSALSSQPECHPFSDTEMSRPKSRFCSRSASPVKSDTEFEVERERASVAANERSAVGRTSWNWGQLPTSQSSSDTAGNTPPTDLVSDSGLLPGTSESGGEVVSQEVPGNQQQQQETPSQSGPSFQSQQQRSMLAGMFSFMRSTRRVRHDPISEGVYLDDLDLQSLEPEVAALYFPRAHVVTYRPAGSSSGGSSFLEEGTPGSSAARGARVSSSIEDDEGHGSSAASSPPPPVAMTCDVALSLCGAVDSSLDTITDLQFARHQVSYEQFAADPAGLLARPQLVVRVDGRLMRWAAAALLLCSIAAFGRQLPSSRVRHPTDEHAILQQAGSGEEEVQESTTSSTITSTSPSSPPPSSNTTTTTVTAKKPSASYSSWFSWRRQSGEPTNSGEIPSVEAADPGNPEPTAKVADPGNPEPSVKAADSPDAEGVADADVVPDDDQSCENTWISQQAASVADESSELPSVVCSESVDLDAVNMSRVSESDDVSVELDFDLSQQVYKKSLRLTSEQVSRLGLHPGRNEAQFSVTTAYQGTTKCHCGIFLWRYDDRVVISDIDGTITKSDVLGHLLPMIGQHWAQSGVTSLFTKIQDNGFKFLYLSARAIGQAPITREYLRSVKQGNVCLPEGPLLLSPSSLVSALHREVIERRPEDFKIPCLKDIAALFPGRKPLYAGFGNRVNDALSYHAVDIPYSRIFTINHRGELRHELTCAFQSSYTNLSDLVDHFFPFSKDLDTVDAHEFNDLAFWRTPPAVIDLPPVD